MDKTSRRHRIKSNFYRLLISYLKYYPNLREKGGGEGVILWLGNAPKPNVRPCIVFMLMLFMILY